MHQTELILIQMLTKLSGLIMNRLIKKLLFRSFKFNLFFANIFNAIIMLTFSVRKINIFVPFFVRKTKIYVLQN